MKTTKQISERLKSILSEIEYINRVVGTDESKLEMQFVFSTGTVSKVPGNTFGTALSRLVTEKILLYWVLDKNLNS
jgi:hypothetical protein